MDDLRRKRKLKKIMEEIKSQSVTTMKEVIANKDKRMVQKKGTI